ncbi:hypothetical protein L6452_13739 [Arctium lappa]|uniref:Uncharacterized protein n=1 Tax=Arctium lappa TaxID=4217 RepID=A0ACB9CJ07_ARCLA|nr:hypothetical protein L6452_13739 [Arctium lappa]
MNETTVVIFLLAIVGRLSIFKSSSLSSSDFAFCRTKKKEKNRGQRIGHKDLHVDGKRLTFDSRQLVVAIRLYWQLELVSVGIKVLETLEALNKFMSQGSAFRKSTCLLYIFEVSKFLLDCCHLNLTYSNRKTLENFLGMTRTYLDLAFPLDWRFSISGDFVSLKETDLSVNLQEEIINFNVKGNITYWTSGRVMMTCLGSRKPLSLYDKILTGLQWNPFWKSFVENFWNGCSKDVYVALQNALQDTFRANWRLPGYISPHSFVYLLDRLFSWHLSHSESFSLQDLLWNGLPIFTCLLLQVQLFRA